VNTGWGYGINGVPDFGIMYEGMFATNFRMTDLGISIQ
jgi:hypothetical protein